MTNVMKWVLNLFPGYRVGRVIKHASMLVDELTYRETWNDEPKEIVT